VVAVGECGLDYYRDLSPRDVQRRVFARHLALARSAELPVVVHCRDAYEECLDILEAECGASICGALHCFQGNAAAARRAIELGLFIGLGGSLTFPREEELRQVVGELSIDRIVLETDAPYLTPRPKRGRNEPAYVRFVASRLAQLHGVSQHRVAQATTDNAVRLFGLRRHA
jgi:TatD DNase family protein